MPTPPQMLLVSCEPPNEIAVWWEQMSAAAPDAFNASFVLSHARTTDD